MDEQRQPFLLYQNLNTEKTIKTCENIKGEGFLLIL
jgi:hypothetical protein